MRVWMVMVLVLGLVGMCLSHGHHGRGHGRGRWGDDDDHRRERWGDDDDGHHRRGRWRGDDHDANGDDDDHGWGDDDDGSGDDDDHGWGDDDDQGRWRRHHRHWRGDDRDHRRWRGGRKEGGEDFSGGASPISEESRIMNEYLKESLWGSTEPTQPLNFGNKQFPDTFETPLCPQHIGPPCPRYYNHKMKDYAPGDDASLSEMLRLTMTKYMNIYVDLIVQNYLPSETGLGESVMIGTAGPALMFLRLYKNFGDISYLDYARQYIEAALTRTTPTPNYVGFLGSYTGIYTTAAIIYNELGDTLKSSKYVDLMKTAIVEGQQCTEDTFYNGKAGLLMAARMLNNYFGEEVIPQSDILIIAQLLLEDGINNGRDGYLVWHNMIFPEVVFLGQGDGSTGVLTQLMQIPQIMANETATSYIKNTLDYYLTIQMPDGNFPTPVQSPYPDQADQLVQWCHGGPGFIPVLTLGYLAFGNEAYLRSADSAADLLWQKGILTKGLMLGHGVSGNTYMFLYMYEKTLNPKYLYRAIKFQEFTLGSPIMVDPTIMRVPSPSPYSLYGGSYGGAVVLWSDMLTGASYHMPGFDAYP